MQFVIVIAIFAFLTGCSTLGFKSEGQKSADILSKYQQKYENSQLMIGVGVGQLAYDAETDARGQLASQILTQVQKSSSLETTLINDEGQSKVERKQSVMAQAFTTLELEDAKILEQGIENDLAYAVIGVDQATANRIRNAARKRLSSLNLVQAISRTQQTSERISLAEKGLQEAKLLEVLDDAVMVDGKRYSFKSYFSQVIYEGLKDLKIAVEKSGRSYKVTLFEDKSLKPVPAIILTLNGKRYRTDSAGRFYVNDLANTNEIYVLVNEEPFYMDTFTQNTSDSTFYFHTYPEKFLVEILQDGRNIASLTTPAYYHLTVEKGARYEAKFAPKGPYAGFTTPLNAQAGLDIFFDKEFEKITFGELSLRLESSANQYQLYNPKGELLRKDSNELIQKTLPVGTYKLVISREDENKDFQILEDEIAIEEDVRIAREYKPLIDREYSRTGRNLYFALGFGALPSKNAPISLTSPGDKTKIYTLEDLPEQSSAMSFLLGYQKLWTHVHFGFEAGFYASSATAENNSTTYNQFSGTPLSLLLGSYTQFDDLDHLFISMGYTRLKADMDAYQSYTGLRSFEVDMSSPFVDVSYDFSNGWWLGYRHFTQETMEDLFVLGFGGAKVEETYAYPAREKARPDEHYQIYAP